MKLTRMISAILVAIALVLAGGCSTSGTDSGTMPNKSSSGGGY